MQSADIEWSGLCLSSQSSFIDMYIELLYKYILRSSYSYDVITIWMLCRVYREQFSYIPTHAGYSLLLYTVTYKAQLQIMSIAPIYACIYGNVCKPCVWLFYKHNSYYRYADGFCTMYNKYVYRDTIYIELKAIYCWMENVI